MALDELVFNHRNFEIKLPKQLKNIYDAIEKSKYILDLKDNYDGENSKVPSYNVWKSAIEFIAEYAKHIYNQHKITIGSLHINDGGKDSIDLSFRMKKTVRMLIHISKKNNKVMASYYGDNYAPKIKPETKKEKESEIKGNIKYFPTKIHEPLANWMKTYLKK